MNSPDASGDFDASYVREIDLWLSHVWMIRAFLKHCEEAEEDDELRDVQRTLYDYMLALGGPLRAGDRGNATAPSTRPGLLLRGVY